MSKGVMFFFGAGAERDFGMPCGVDFLKETIVCKDFSNTQGEALSNYFSNCYFHKGYRYTKHRLANDREIFRRFLYEKALNNQCFFDSYQAFIKGALTKNDYQEILDNFGIAKDCTEKENDDKIEMVLSTFHKIIGDEVKYNDITCPILKELFSHDKDGNIEVDFKIGASGLLDNYFHTIINPKRFGTQKFSKIFNYYWAIYFSITKAIINSIVNIEANPLREYVSLTGMDYKKVLYNINDFTEILYSSGMEEFISQMYSEGNNYYAQIRQYIKNKAISISYATTNYYRFADVLLDKQVIKLNGGLDLFEFPEKLTVKSLAVNNIGATNSEIFFPFVFGQSYSKPIIHKFQVEAFHDFYEGLQRSEILVILGHSLSPDDNHVNAYIKEFLDNNGKMICVTDKEEEFLPIFSDNKANIIFLVVDYENSRQTIVESIFSKIEEIEND